MKTLIYLPLTAFLLACSSTPTALPTAAPTPPKPAAPAKAKTERAEVPSIFDRSGDDYSYNPVGKRDPFMSFTEEAVVEDSSLPKSPLERYTLDQLKLTAIVWGISDPRALIMAPDTQSYIVRTNMRMGRNRGRISKITKRSVFVEEEYRDPTGKLVVNEQELEIHSEQKKPEEEVSLKMVEE